MAAQCTFDNWEMRRRDLLKAAGASAIGAAVLSGETAASSYERTLDVVDDLGVDDTGSVAIDGDLRPHLSDGTLLQFPDGRYRIDQLITYALSDFGMVATGDATLVPGDLPESNLWIAGGDVRNFRFEGFDIDNSGAVGPTIAFGATDGLVVRDITKRGAHASHNAAFGFSITDPAGSGLVENLKAGDGDAYHDERGATGVYTKTKGTLTFRDCTISNWGDNGLYGSQSVGSVHVKGGYYANSNVAQVRVSSAGSTVSGVRVEVNESRGGERNQRGIRVCEGEGPVTVSDCDIVLSDGQGSGGIVTAFDGGSLVVENTRVHVEESYTTVGSGGTRTSYGVLVDEATDVAGPTRTVLDGVSVTGGGTQSAAVEFRRGNATVRNSCINQTGSDRDGVVFRGATTDNRVDDSTISVPTSAIVRGDATVATSDLAYEGSCPVPTSVSYSQHAVSASTSLGDVPFPSNASRIPRPTMGTSSNNPTAVVYGDVASADMRSFVDGNLQSLVDDYVVTGSLNLQFRLLPETDANDYLTQVLLGVWDKEWDAYWGLLDYLVHHPGVLPVSSVSDARTLLREHGVSNYGWIPWLAAGDDYADIVSQNRARAADAGVTDSSDYPPILYFDGDVAAPNYGYDGLSAWIDRRL